MNNLISSSFLVLFYFQGKGGECVVRAVVLRLNTRISGVYELKNSNRTGAKDSRARQLNLM